VRTALELEELLLSETAPDRRLRSFAALLAADSGLGTSRLTVVGGSAIEIYTNGSYVSGDIDLVVADPTAVKRVLRSWGFKDEGKLWTHAKLGLFVDIVGKLNSGSDRLTRVVQTEYGSLRLGAVEDLIVKRLLEVRYWGQKAALAQAILLTRQYGADLDWEYIDFFSKKDGLHDLVTEMRKRSGLA
jgi:hypothetical protein